MPFQPPPPSFSLEMAVSGVKRGHLCDDFLFNHTLQFRSWPCATGCMTLGKALSLLASLHLSLLTYEPGEW